MLTVKAKIRRALFGAVVLAALPYSPLRGWAFTLQTDEQAPNVPVEKRGPEVGSPVPDFRLKDQAGDEKDVASLMGKDGLVILFFRSADW